MNTSNNSKLLLPVDSKKMDLEDLFCGDFKDLPIKIAKFFKDHYEENKIQKLEFIDTSREFGFALVTYDYETDEDFRKRIEEEKNEKEKERKETIQKIQMADFLTKEQKDSLIYDIIQEKTK